MTTSKAELDAQAAAFTRLATMLLPHGVKFHIALFVAVGDDIGLSVGTNIPPGSGEHLALAQSLLHNYEADWLPVEVV